MSTETSVRMKTDSPRMEPFIQSRPRKLTAFSIEPSDAGVFIRLEGHVYLKPRRGLPGYIRGTIEHRYQSIPVIDTQARKTNQPEPITDKSCIVLFRDEKLDSCFHKASLHHDVMEVVDMIDQFKQDHSYLQLNT